MTTRRNELKARCGLLPTEPIGRRSNFPGGQRNEPQTQIEVAGCLLGSLHPSPPFTGDGAQVNSPVHLTLDADSYIDEMTLAPLQTSQVLRVSEPST